MDLTMEEKRGRSSRKNCQRKTLKTVGKYPPFTWSVLSGFFREQLRAMTSEWSSRYFKDWSKMFCLIRVSELRKRRCSPLAFSMAKLLPPPKPRFFSLRKMVKYFVLAKSFLASL